MPNVYFALHLDDKHVMGNIPDIGQWQNFYVYDVDDQILFRLNLANVQPVFLPSKEVAMGWKFAAEIRDYMRVGEGGVMANQLGEENLHPHKPGKFTYYLNDTDRSLGVEFARIILRTKLYREYGVVLTSLQSKYSKIYNYYITHVLNNCDDDEIQRIQSRMPGLLERHKEYNNKLKILANEVYDIDLMIEDAKSPHDVAKVLSHILDKSVLAADTIRRVDT